MRDFPIAGLVGQVGVGRKGKTTPFQDWKGAKGTI